MNQSIPLLLQSVSAEQIPTVLKDIFKDKQHFAISEMTSAIPVKHFTKIVVLLWHNLQFSNRKYQRIPGCLMIFIRQLQIVSLDKVNFVQSSKQNMANLGYLISTFQFQKKGIIPVKVNPIP